MQRPASQKWTLRVGRLTEGERTRLRKAWTEEPDLTLHQLTSRFRLRPAELKRVCAGLARPKRSTLASLKRSVTLALNDV